MAGAVTRAEVISSAGDGLGEAALLAARELRFSPARLRGTPVATGQAASNTRTPTTAALE